MDTLVRFGFSIEDIKNMMDSNQQIEKLDEQTIKEIIKILKDINCTEEEIKNILITNPFCLNIDINTIKELIRELKDLNIKKLNILFNSNPYLLNNKNSIKKIKKDDNLYNELMHLI